MRCEEKERKSHQIKWDGSNVIVEYVWILPRCVQWFSQSQKKMLLNWYALIQFFFCCDCDK